MFFPHFFHEKALFNLFSVTNNGNHFIYIIIKTVFYMLHKNLIEIFIKIISAIIPPIVIYIFQKWNTKSNHKGIDNFDLFKNNCENLFVDDFMKKDLAEYYFFIRTGIETNYNTIFKLQTFKDKLGCKGKWITINKALPHLNIKDTEGITVFISPKEEKKYKRNSILALSIFISAILLILSISYIAQDIFPIVNQLIILFMISFISSILIYLLISPINSINKAKYLKNLLKENSENE